MKIRENARTPVFLAYGASLHGGRLAAELLTVAKGF